MGRLIAIRCALVGLLGGTACWRAPVQTAQSCTVPAPAKSSISFGPTVGNPRLAKDDAIHGLVVSVGRLEPVFGAQVSIDSLRITVASDSMGRFRIGGIPHGDYLVTVLAVGHFQATARVTYEGSTTVVATLGVATLGDYSCWRVAPTPLPMPRGSRRPPPL